MIKRGLVDEVKQLLDRGYDASLPAMSGIGYKQITMYLKGELTLADAVQQTKFETHRLVRHQYSWFRLKDDRIGWFDIQRDKEAKILNRLKKSYQEQA
jgi:tRNA dimethylallyltransferase